MIQISYWTHWSEFYDEGGAPLTEQQARERHERAESYSVYLADATLGDSYIDLWQTSRGDCIVCFLDQQRRAILCHSYDPLQDQRLFLSAAYVHHYQGENRTASWGRVFYYERDGNLWITEGKIGRAIRLNTFFVVDVQNHYIPVPAFGDYEPFLHRDRHARPPKSLEDQVLPSAVDPPKGE
jgi:hypothetical protein